MISLSKTLTGPQRAEEQVRGSGGLSALTLTGRGVWAAPQKGMRPGEAPSAPVPAAGSGWRCLSCGPSRRCAASSRKFWMGGPVSLTGARRRQARGQTIAPATEASLQAPRGGVLCPPAQFRTPMLLAGT